MRCHCINAVAVGSKLRHETEPGLTSDLIHIPNDLEHGLHNYA